jgi:nucleoside-diphosphate-sugar epimerase
MRVLVIGGTGFIGPFVVRRLVEAGHELAVYHRGNAKPDLPDGVRHILGDRRSLADSASEFHRLSPDVVVDVILASERQAQATMDVFRGIAGRVVALSSGDVYRAMGVLHGTEPGPIQPMPLTEESELRTNKPYGEEMLEVVRKTVPYFEDEYDKIPVERVILNDAELAGTVVRLPMVHGPGDAVHRLHSYLKRMDDDRPAILIQEDAARWRAPRGYVENVAAGIVLAATSRLAAGRIYNLAEPRSLTESQWVEAIGRVAGWKGSVSAVPKDLTPAHLRVPNNWAQDLVMSSARIRRELGFAEPIPFTLGLARTIEWERANPPAQVDAAGFDYAAEDAALELVAAAGG